MTFHDATDGNDRGQNIESRELGTFAETAADRSSWSETLENSRFDKIGNWRVYFRNYHGRDNVFRSSLQVAAWLRR